MDLLHKGWDVEQRAVPQWGHAEQSLSLKELIGDVLIGDAEQSLSLKKLIGDVFNVSRWDTITSLSL